MPTEHWTTPHGVDVSGARDMARQLTPGVVWGWGRLPPSNAQNRADIEALEEAMAVMSAQVVEVRMLAASPLMQRDFEHAITFLETGLLWLESAIGGAKERLLPVEGE